jgi:hypothetical protein
MYNEIKKNIIENFFNRNYRYTVVSCRKRIIDDISERLPFVVTTNNACDILVIYLGDNISISFALTWEVKNNGSMTVNKLVMIS